MTQFTLETIFISIKFQSLFDRRRSDHQQFLLKIFFMTLKQIKIKRRELSRQQPNRLKFMVTLINFPLRTINRENSISSDLIFYRLSTRLDFHAIVD